jgi:hypothetical protein
MIVTKRIRIERPKHRRERWWLEIFPIDPRDPDVFRVKSHAYAEGAGRDPLEGAVTERRETGEGRKTPRFLSDFSSVHPTGQKSKKYPQVEGHVLRLSARHAKLRREGYRKREHR